MATKKYSHIDFKPPEGVAKAAERGLELRKEAPKSKKGGLSVSQAKKEGVGSGVQRAVNLKNRDTLNPDTVKRMNNFFNRHAKNKKIDAGKKASEDKGYQAWMLWGGDPGASWARKIVRQMNAADKKAKMESFMDDLMTETNQSLMEAIKKGFDLCMKEN
jgi:hypothetical protein